MRIRRPGRSPSWDRASLYIGPPVLKRARVSRAPPSSGGHHLMVAELRPHARISAAPSMLALCSTTRGGGALGGARTRCSATSYGAPGPPAAIPWSLRPNGPQEPPQKLRLVVVGCVVPTPPVRRRRTALPGFPASVLSYTTGSTQAPTPCPQRAPQMQSWSCVR